MKKTCFFSTLVLVIVILFTVVAEFAWAGFGISTVYGKVINHYTGAGIGGATINFISVGNNVTYTAKPDGCYVVNLLASSGYTMRVGKKFYKELYKRNLSFSADGFHRHNFRLHPVKEFRIDRISNVGNFYWGVPKTQTWRLHGHNLHSINGVRNWGSCYGFSLNPANPRGQTRTMNARNATGSALRSPEARLQPVFVL